MSDYPQRELMAKETQDTRASASCFWRWIRRLAIAVAVLAVLLVAAGVAYQAIASARDWRKYPPPGKRISVGGYRLHIQTAGEGGAGRGG